MYFHFITKQQNEFTLLCQLNIYITRYLFPTDNRDPKEYHKKLFYLSWNSLDIILIVSSGASTNVSQRSMFRNCNVLL